MSLFGKCDDCGESAQLNWKPLVPLNKQNRPSVCYRCKTRREELAEEHDRERYPRDGGRR